jgi:hypothetical protein
MSEPDRRYEQRFASVEREIRDGLSAARREVEHALIASEKAILKAEQAAEKRFDAVNEFRQTLSDQASTFISRSEAQARIEANADKIDVLAARLDKAEGRGSGISSTIGVLIGAGGLLVAVVAVLVAVLVH